MNNYTDESAVVKAQEADSEINVLTGMEFEAADDAAKAEDAKIYIENMGISDKASLYKMVSYQDASMGNTAAAGSLDESQMAAALDMWLANSPDEEVLTAFYDEYIAGTTYEDNMESFGKVSYDCCRLPQHLCRHL